MESFTNIERTRKYGMRKGDLVARYSTPNVLCEVTSIDFMDNNRFEVKRLIDGIITEDTPEHYKIINKVEDKMKPEEPTTEIALSDEQENAQIALLAKPSILNVAKNKPAYEALRDEYTGIVLPDFKDPEFKKVHKRITEGSGKLVKARTAASKLVKQEEGVLKQVIGLIKAEGEKLIAITAPIEKEIKALKDTADQMVEDDKQEQLRLIEEQKQARIAKLFELGMKFNGAYYEIGELTLTSLQVTQYSEAQFEGFVAQAKVVYEAEQLRIAEEEEKAEQQRKDAEAEQLRLHQENEANQQALNSIKQEQELMRLERTEARGDALKSRGFEGGLKEGGFWIGTMTINASFIIEANKQEWDAKLKEANSYIDHLNKPKTPVIEPVFQPIVKPLNGTSIKVAQVAEEVVFSDVLAVDECVNQEIKTINHEVRLTFNSNNPFIDTPIGKSTLRIYVEPFLDEAQEGLTKEMVAASGSISDELLFLVIKGK